MSTVVGRLLSRIKPPVLRSNDPHTPFKTRARHPLLEETRFLLLTRRGPVEIVVKPTYLVAAAFIGMVGAGVIAATTLFIGYKSVEVVSNDTITSAVASVSLEDPMDSGQDFMPLVNANEGIDGDVTGQSLKLAFNDDNDEDLAAKLSPVSDSPAAIRPVGSEASENKSLDLSNIIKDDDITSIALQRFAPTATEPEIAKMAALKLPTPQPPIPQESIVDAPVSDATIVGMEGNGGAIDGMTQGTGALIGSTAPTAADALMAMLKAPFSSPFKNSLEPWVEPNGDGPGSADTQTETVLAPDNAITIALSPGRMAAMVPFAPDSEVPVVNSAVRQLKMLRSMTREVISIRKHMIGLGVAESYLPPTIAWEQQVVDADFASLTMALESHRSALNKVPLKPPMLYFYISSPYGKRKHPVTGQIRQHHGIDLAGTWQEEVHASAPGTVIHAGKMGSFGNVVRVRHAYDITTTYAHLSRILVRKGSDVTHGTVIGKMGRTGRVDGAHLHYEIRVGRKSLDPQIFFNIGHRIGTGGALTQISLGE